MTSFTLSLSGDKSELSANYFPPIQLDENSEYVCGLVDFQTYMSIPNVNETNNRFHYLKTHRLVIERGEYTTTRIQQLIKKCIQPNIEPPLLKDVINDDFNSIKVRMEGSEIAFTFLKESIFNFKHIAYIEIPEGSYELESIESFLKDNLAAFEESISLHANKNTLRSILKCSTTVFFDRENSVGSLLGFDQKRVLEHSIDHESDSSVKINAVNVIKIECNITSGAYFNDKACHTLHEFYPMVATGYKIIEIPRTLIYLPVIIRSIHNLTIRIVDQNNNLLNFRGETISLRIHIKKNLII